jgi:uncharacterized protein with HEPN domain
MSRDPAYLLDILNHARLIQSLTHQVTEADFNLNIEKQLAIKHALTLIGEASRRLSEALQQSRPDIPWADMIGLRNVLVHRYDEIALDRLWRIIQVSIPDLIAKIAPLIPPEAPTQTDETAEGDVKP